MRRSKKKNVMGTQDILQMHRLRQEHLRQKRLRQERILTNELEPPNYENVINHAFNSVI
jgi:hypothetical protein